MTAKPSHSAGDRQDFLDNLSTGVMALDAALRVTSINAAGQAILENSELQCVGLHAGQLLRSSQAWVDSLEQVLASRRPQAHRSMPLTLHTGQQIHADLMITPLGNNESNEGLLIELQAVDRLLRISREDSQASAQETTRAVIRGLAHEIKNPLGGVRGAAQLLARKLDSEALTEYTDVIIREADRLRDLVDRLLGPNQEPQLQQINIHRVLEHVRKLMEAESDQHATIIRDYDPSLPELPGDRTQLIQAVLNITRNALQAAPCARDCVITLRSRSQRQFTIGSVCHRLVCRIDILDNGPGIPDHLGSAIFAPMVTGRADGTGLGLSIAQSIVQRHGGLLEYDSEPGQTCFTLYLPMDNDHAASS